MFAHKMQESLTAEVTLDDLKPAVLQHLLRSAKSETSDVPAPVCVFRFIYTGHLHDPTATADVPTAQADTERASVYIDVLNAAERFVLCEAAALFEARVQVSAPASGGA